MKFFFPIGIILILCVGLLIYRAAKGPAYTLNSIDGPINGLLKQGYDGGFLIINISYSKKFIQFRKYINSPGEYGLSLDFPNARWSSALYEKVKSYCERNSVEYKTISRHDEGRKMEFLCVDFKRDINMAHEFLKGILCESFGVDGNVKLFARLENATIEDRLIDGTTS